LHNRAESGTAFITMKKMGKFKFHYHEKMKTLLLPAVAKLGMGISSEPGPVSSAVNSSSVGTKFDKRLT
jgi:hypothetical protein